MLTRFHNYAIDTLSSRVKVVNSTTSWDTHMEYDQVPGQDLSPAEAAVVIGQWQQSNQPAVRPHLDQ